MQRFIDNTAFQLGCPAGQQMKDKSWVNGDGYSRLYRCSLPHAIPTRYNSRVQITHITANGNGVERVDPGDVDDDANYVPQGIDPAIAKEKLLRVLTELINDDSQIQEVEKLILQLESLRATPITDIFTEMGLAGNWDLLFSSSRTKAAGHVRIRRIGQVIDTDKKQLINKANWSFPAKNGIDFVRADLSVICSYAFVGPGRLQVMIDEHKIKILGSEEEGKKHEMPDDLQAVVADLQLSLPMDFFDPSGLIDVSYMEPNFRLARFVGKRIAGVRNVFIRAKDG